MKILFTHRFYWPDTAPYALMLRQIAKNFADAGHDVHVLASQPSYRENVAAIAEHDEASDVRINRCFAFQGEKKNLAKRVLNVLIYCLALGWHIIRIRPDVVTASTFPPVLAAWSACIAARLVGARFVYHVQDIHPEVSLYSNGRMGRGIFLRFFRWLDNHTLRHASAIVVLSEDMADTIRERGVIPKEIIVIENPMLDSKNSARATPSDLDKKEGNFRIIFAGNLGRFQNLEKLTEGAAAAIEVDHTIELLFLGDGEVAETLMQRWGSHPQVNFWPFLPFEHARRIISESDLGLVSLIPGMYRVASPSKLATYFGLGLPTVLLVEPESQIAGMVELNGLGGVPISDGVSDIAETILQLRRKTPTRSHIESWYRANLSDEVIMKKWHRIIDSLEKT